MNKDLDKKMLYEAVKILIENSAKFNKIHLTQAKLFTLYSVAFQYMLFNSTKNPGHYIIRIENSQLADKLTKRAKDISSRRFLQSLMLPRRFKYEKSIFLLDFFYFGSWNLTNEIPLTKIKGALIVKNTSSTPMDELFINDTEADAEEKADANAKQSSKINIPEDFYLTSLAEISPKTIVIAYDKVYQGFHKLNFDFFKQQKKCFKGVTLNHDIDWDED